MPPQVRYSAIFITVPDQDNADKIANSLVERKLCACVNIVPGLKSVYREKDKVTTAQELLLIAKTRTTLVPEISEWVKTLHSYDNPEVISFPIDLASQQYLDWVGANTVFSKGLQRRDGKLGFADG